MWNAGWVLVRNHQSDPEPFVLAGRYRLLERLPFAESERWRAEDLVLERPVTVTFPASGGRPVDPRDPSIWDAGSDDGRPFTITAFIPANDTQIMPAFGMPGPAPAVRSRSGRLLPAVTGGLVVAAVVAVIVVVSSGSESAPTASAPQASASIADDGASRPATPQTPSASPSASAAAPRGPMDLLTAFQQRLEQQAANDQLDPEVGEDVREDLSKIAEKLSEGKTEDIHGKLIDIRAELRDAAREGEWTPDPATARLLQQLLDTFDRRTDRQPAGNRRSFRS
jgi:hypothetical protein